MTSVSPFPGQLIDAPDEDSENLKPEVVEKIEEEITKGKEKAITDLNTALDELAELETLKRELDKKHKEKKAAVVETMKAEGRKSAETENIRVSITSYTSTTIDVPKLREYVSPAIIKEVERRVEKERVNVRLKKGPAEEEEEREAPDVVIHNAPTSDLRALSAPRGMTKKQVLFLGRALAGVAFIAMVVWAGREMYKKGV